VTGADQLAECPRAGRTPSFGAMLYSLVVLLIVVAAVLFLAKVAVGGGMIGVLAIVLLVWLVLGGGPTRGRV
jgi:hypothetical protein